MLVPMFVIAIGNCTDLMDLSIMFIFPFDGNCNGPVEVFNPARTLNSSSDQAYIPFLQQYSCIRISKPKIVEM